MISVHLFYKLIIAVQLFTCVFGIDKPIQSTRAYSQLNSPSKESMHKSVQRIAKLYEKMITRYPYTINCGTGFVIASIGDVACQKYMPKSTKNAKFEWDMRRTLDMGLIRAGVITPFISFWYPLLARVFPGKSILRVLGRVSLDQAVGSPIVICLVFLISSLLKGDNIFAVKDRIQAEFSKTWLAGLKYWPFVHMINFGMLPLIYQPLFAHFASIYWNAVLSYYSNTNLKEV